MAPQQAAENCFFCSSAGRLPLASGVLLLIPRFPLRLIFMHSAALMGGGWAVYQGLAVGSCALCGQGRPILCLISLLHFVPAKLLCGALFL